MILKGQQEIAESDPTLRAIVSAHDMDTRLIHGYIQIKNESIVNAKD
jgi:hypothetical protein